jgi:hypothetical protein
MVESPHKTSFYARETDGYGDDKNWQEAAQYWYTHIAIRVSPFTNSNT